MYKTASRNMQSRRFRSSKAGSMKRARYTRRGKAQWGGGNGSRTKRLSVERKGLKTEIALIEKLGAGPKFIRTVFKRYQHDFAKFDYEPKHCSAYLNLKARIRLLDGSMWTDEAVKSMFRRVR